MLHEVEGHVVHSAVDDDVRVDPGGLHVEVMHGLYGGEVLIDDVFDLPAPLLGVPQHPSEDSLVRIRIHEDLDVHQVPEALVVKGQDPLQEDDPLGLDPYRGLGPVVIGIVIGRGDDGFPRLQLLKVLEQQVRIEGVGMIVVELFPLLKGHVVVGLVVVVVVDHRHLVSKGVPDAVGEGGFSGAGPSGDTDQNGFHGFLLFASGRGKAPALLSSYIIEAAGPLDKPAGGIFLAFFRKVLEGRFYGSL